MTPQIQGRSSRSSPSWSAARSPSSTAGPGSSGSCSTSCRSSAACRARSASGSPAATRATATCSACFAASSSRRRCSDARRPSSPLFDPRAGVCPASSLRAEVAGDRLVALEERERVALGVLAAREPADRRDRLLLARVAAGRGDLRERGVDVVGGQVDDRPAAGLVGLVDRADGLLALRHEVLERPFHPGECPAEDAAPEALGPIDVGRGQLEVNDGCHGWSLSGDGRYTRAGPTTRRLRCRC